MALLGNILWFILGGWLLALAWLISGAFWCITIIGIPFGFACFRIAGFAAFPYGKELVDSRLVGHTRVAGTGIANVLWLILNGLWIAIGHVLTGAAWCLTIIGIPFGIAHFKIASVALAPLGKVPVPIGTTQRLIAQAHAQPQVQVFVQNAAPGMPTGHN